MSRNEHTIKQEEARKAHINRLLKGKLADNIEASQVKEDTWYARLVGSPPDGVNVGARDGKLHVVIDQVEHYPSFFKLLYCSLDFTFVQIYTLLFCQLELIWGGDGNSLLSLFVVYLLERFLRYVRHELGERNVVKKAYVDERFLV